MTLDRTGPDRTGPVGNGAAQDPLVDLFLNIVEINNYQRQKEKKKVEKNAVSTKLFNGRAIE